MAPDIESRVYTYVTKAARAAYPKLTCSSWAENVPSSFPYALVCMTDEYDVARTETSTHDNEYRHVTFEVNVYSAAASGRKSEARAISRTIARAFKVYGFVETAGGRPMDLTDDSKRAIARYFCRFEGAVSPDGIVYTD